MVLSIIGLVFTIIPSIVALVLATQVRRRHPTASSAATASRARVIAVVGLFTSAIIAASVVTTGLRAGGGANGAYASLQTGDCFNLHDAGGSVSVHQVSCTTPHNAEAVGRVTAPDGAWPGPAGFAVIADQPCASDAAAYLGDNDPGPNVVLKYIFPEQSAWDAGQRTVLCELRTKNGAKVTGQIGAATTIT